MRAPILALLLLALASSRQAFAAETVDTITAMQNNCLVTAAGATNAECKDCVQEIGDLDGLTSQRMYACYDVCQDATLFAPGFTTGEECITCISDPLKTVQGCKDCMDPTFDADATSGCFTCLDADPWANVVLDQANQYKRDSYFYACAQCSKIPAGSARQQCYTCIASDVAKLQTEGGILTYTERYSGGYVERANDFGACVFLANQSYLISIGSVEVPGAYANCVPEEGEVPNIPIQRCLACMDFVDGLQATDSADIPLRSYGCADYCQDPKAYPTGLTQSAIDDLADQCLTCMENPDLTSAWACGNCLKTAVPDSCYSCVAADPYSGNTSNYNWACGMCAGITDPDLRALCISCIQSQPGVGAEDTDKTTEANICSCIDLVANNAFDVSRPLTAMERTCFEPFQYYNETNDLVIPDIPWGNDVVSPVGTNNSQCLNCMKIASDTDILPGINKAYACHEYCQNPALVADAEQGLDCARCVTSDQVTDPWACQTCMAATDDTLKRKDCFTCLRAGSIWPSQAWGCSQCAQFSSEAASAACYQCLSTDAIDPCACVDGVKNGTIQFAPGGPDDNEAVCEHSFATLGCPDNEITGHVITSITNLFYGRIVNDQTTCSDPDNLYCGSPSPVCRGSGLTSTCNADPAMLAAVTTTAENQCVGRAFCNQLAGGYDTDFGPYTLVAENSIFNDPCVGVYKYMTFDYTCGPPAP